jgi:hypothetical protein
MRGVTRDDATGACRGLQFCAFPLTSSRYHLPYLDLQLPSVDSSIGGVEQPLIELPAD